MLDFEGIPYKFDNYFKPKVNVIRMRRLFQRRIQERNENEEAYFRDLHAAAEDCEFGDLEKERIRDQFISGISDESLAEELQHLYMSKQDNFTLDVVIEYSRTYCDIRTGRAMEKQIKREHVDEISHKEKKITSYQHNKEECRYCGTSHGKNSCPAYVKKCAACGKSNHFARVCRSERRNTRRVHEVTAGDDKEDEGYFLGECTNNNSGSCKWNVNVK